jgi:hypothetical protein
MKKQANKQASTQQGMTVNQGLFAKKKLQKFAKKNCGEA